MDKKTFICASYRNHKKSSDATKLYQRDEIERAVEISSELEGTTTKGKIVIDDTAYFLKNHSNNSFQNKKTPFILRQIKGNIQRLSGRVEAGTADIRYKKGTPTYKVNLMSLREALASDILSIISTKYAFHHGEKRPFEVPEMRALIDHHENSKQPRVRLVSELRNFTTIDHFAYSPTDSKKLPPYHKGSRKKDIYATLNQNKAWHTDPKTNKRDEFEIDKVSMAFASVIPTILADYDIPGSNGCNIGVTHGKKNLTFFDFGHSLSPLSLRKHNVTSDLKAHNFTIGGRLNQRREHGFNRSSNIIRQYKGAYMVDAPLSEKIDAFKNIYETFINPHANRRRVITHHLKSFNDMKLNELREEGILTNSQYNYYRKHLRRSVDAFTTRLKHIHKIVEPRLSLSIEQLNILENLEMLTSVTIPTKLSKTGFIIHRDSAISGITHRHSFEIKGDKIVTQSKDAIERLQYFFFREYDTRINIEKINGFYQIPLTLIPKKLEIPAYSEQGRRNLVSTFSHSKIANDLSRRFPEFFSQKNYDIGTLSNRVMEFNKAINETVSNIKTELENLHHNKDFLEQVLQQFFNTPLVEGSTPDAENHHCLTLHDAMANIIDSSRGKSHASVYSLKSLSKKYSPENQRFPLSMEHEQAGSQTSAPTR